MPQTTTYLSIALLILAFSIVVVLVIRFWFRMRQRRVSSETSSPQQAPADDLREEPPLDTTVPILSSTVEGAELSSSFGAKQSGFKPLDQAIKLPQGEDLSPCKAEPLLEDTSRTSVPVQIEPRLATLNRDVLNETKQIIREYTASGVESKQTQPGSVIQKPSPVGDQVAVRRLPQDSQPDESTPREFESSPHVAGKLNSTQDEHEPTPTPPVYHPPKPPTPKNKMSNDQTPTSSPSTTKTDLQLRLQLVFGRGGIVKTMALVPDKRLEMPSDLELTGTQGKLSITELRDDCYEPVPIPDPTNTLRQGIEWHGRDGGHRYRWTLGGRSLYVLSPGDEFGLHGFISAARLGLNTRNTVLVEAFLREDVSVALANAGCVGFEVNDDKVPGVPSGWLLFRDVTPTRAVPMRGERDILNALCPAHEVEPHFVGGIRLERNTWLSGFPPRIRLTGGFESDFRVMIDGQTAYRASDGAFEAKGWDGEGEHRIWFGDRVETYTLHKMEEDWDSWRAYCFGSGAAICGAGICRGENQLCRQVRVPATNPLLLGAQPGDIFYCRAAYNIRSQSLVALVPFSPVWALPIDPAHVDKDTGHLILLEPLPPRAVDLTTNRNKGMERNLRVWFVAINNAGRKQLRLAGDSEEGKALWRLYRTTAKQIWRRMR